MISMTAEQIDRFHADLRSLLIAGVPLSFSASGKPASEARLEQLNRQAHRATAAGGISPADLEQNETQLPVRYQAALVLWAHTGNMPLVLDGLTSDQQAARALSRTLRATLIYLLLLVAVGYIGLFVFGSFTAPRIDALKHDLALVPKAGEDAAADLTPVLTSALWVIPVAAIVIVGVLWWAGGMTRLAGWLGGRRYSISAAAATATQVARALIAAGVAAARANEVACDVVAGGSTMRAEIARRLKDSGERQQSAAGLATMAEQFRLVAFQRLGTLNLVAPIALVVLVGGATALAFAVVIFWPVVELYYDVASVGTFSGAGP